MALVNIGLLIVSIGAFLLMIALSFEVFMNVLDKFPDIFKIRRVGKSETPDPSQDHPVYLEGIFYRPAVIQVPGLIGVL